MEENLLKHPTHFDLSIDDNDDDFDLDEASSGEASDGADEVVQVTYDGNDEDNGKQHQDWQLNTVVHFNVHPADVITLKEDPKSKRVIVSETNNGLKRLIGLPILYVNDKDVSHHDAILLQELWKQQNPPMLLKFGVEPIPGVTDVDSIAASSTYQSFEDHIVFRGPTSSVAYDAERDKKLNEAYGVPIYDDVKLPDEGNLEDISEGDEAVMEISKMQPISYKGIRGDQSGWSNKCKKRAEIIQELVNTEQSYINGLKELHREFLKPFGKELKKSAGVDVSHFEIKIANLIHLHKGIYDRFEKADNLCTVFLEDFKFVKMYKPYIKAYEETFRHLREASKKRAFKWIFKRVGGRVSADPLGYFQARGITIVQRPPRYILLLADLKKKTPKQHPMYADLENGLKEIETTCGDINGYLLQLENEHKLFELSQEIDQQTLRDHGVKQLVAPARRLVRWGDVAIKKYKPNKSTKSFYRRVSGNTLFERATVVMCNDILLIKRGKKNRVIRVFKIAEMETIINQQAVEPSSRDQRFDKLWEVILRKMDDEEIQKLKTQREQERMSLQAYGSFGSGRSNVRLRQASLESVGGEEFSIYLSTYEEAEEWEQDILKYANLE